jgi:hypothetical protein
VARLSIGFSLGFEQALEAALVSGREESDHSSGARFVGEFVQRRRDRRHEALVGAAQHELQLRRRSKRRVGQARVLERPRHQLLDELGGKRGVPSALCSRQQHDHGRTMLETEVEQLTGQRVVRGARRQLRHVGSSPEREHAGSRALPELANELRGNGGVEQLLLARKILVQVADGRARALGDTGHGRGLVARLSEARRSRRHEPVAHVLFRNLGH